MRVKTLQILLMLLQSLNCAELDLKAALRDTGVAVLALEAFDGSENASKLNHLHTVTLFTVSDVAMVYASVSDKIFAFAMNMVSGKPVPDVSVKVVAREMEEVGFLFLILTVVVCT